MTVLLLGDSFADRMGRTGPWCDILADELKEDVENYGLGGSALSYSYNAFLKHYKPGKYSRVIFVTTDVYRQFYTRLHYYDKQYMSFHANKKTSVDENKRLYKEIDTDYIDIEGGEFTSAHNIILRGQENINALYPHTYDWTKRAITDSIKYTVNEPLLILDVIDEMMNIQRLDYEHLNIEFKPKLETKRRPNHFSIKQSQEFGKYVARYFTEDFDIRKVFSNPKEYFTVSKTKEEAGIK